MKTLETQSKPPRTRKQNVELPAAMPLTLPGILALLGRSWKKVRFPDRETAKRGFRVLYRSGRGVDISGDFVFGVSGPEQLELLKTNKIPFEMVN